MTKNRLLNIAITICKSFKILLVLLIIGLTSIFIHLQFDRGFYSSKNINVTTDSGEYFYSTKWKVNSNKDYNEIFTIDKLKTGSMYLLYLKHFGILVLLFLCIREFQKILKSVKGVKTFGEVNVVSFRRIGKFLIGYAVLTSYSFVDFENGGFKGFHLPYTALFLVLFSFIMAEIFKEGSLLKEENDLTI